MEEDGEFVDQDYNQDGEQYADDDYDDGEIIGDSEEKELGELRGNDIINNTSNMLNKPSASAKKLQANARRCSESSQNSNLSSNSNQSGMQKDINDADGSGGGLIDTQNAYCHMCKRKFYSYNFLRNHMSKIHNMSLPKRSMNGNVIDDSGDMGLLANAAEEASLKQQQQQQHLNDEDLMDDNGLDMEECENGMSDGDEAKDGKIHFEIITKKVQLNS